MVQIIQVPARAGMTIKVLNMFENLSDRLGKVVQNLKGQGRITEDNIKDTLREVRMALLEACLLYTSDAADEYQRE